MSTRAQILEVLKQNLIIAQERMKFQADKRRSERLFEVGDWVYLRLQPYRQQYLTHRKSWKLSTKLYGPFKVIKIGQVAYQLDLPPKSKLYPIFHVSLLKPKLGQHTSLVPTLPPIDVEGLLSPELIAVLQRRSKQRRNRIITEVLVQWHDTTTENATWVLLHQLQNQYPHLVGKVL